jgi:hypothetical protein
MTFQCMDTNFCFIVPHLIALYKKGMQNMSHKINRYNSRHVGKKKLLAGWLTLAVKSSEPVNR